jgi:protein SCO1/2
MRRSAYIFAVCGFVLQCAAWSTGCTRSREYEIRGQVLAIDVARRVITVKHEDIRGFMPGMTMPFRVRERALVDGRTPGELIRATLVIETSDTYLKAIERIGSAPLVDALPVRVDPVEPGNVVPDVNLVDDTGRPRRLADWRGHVVAVTFIYTRCPFPDFCPRLDQQFAEVQRAISEDDGLRRRVRLLSVSFDTAFDTPAVLAAHARKVGANPASWSFATGDSTEIATFAARLGVSVVRNSPSPSDIVHNMRTAVIDGDGRLVKIVNGAEWTTSDLVAELRRASGAR